MSFSPPRPTPTRAASPIALQAPLPGSSAVPRRDAYHLRWPAREPDCGVTAGLCLLPAAGFLWSGPRGLPRTRGDFVLVCLTAGSVDLRLPRGAGALDGLAFLPAGTAFALQPDADAEGMTLLLGRDVAIRAALAFPSTIVVAPRQSSAPAALQDCLRTVAKLAQRDPGAMRSDTADCLAAMAGLIARLSPPRSCPQGRAATSPLFATGRR